MRLITSRCDVTRCPRCLSLPIKASCCIRDTLQHLARYHNSLAISCTTVTTLTTLRVAWDDHDERERLLRVIQPGLIGLIDGTISTLAPIFAAAFAAGSHAALLVGLAAALGAAISMGMSEALSDDGSLTGRGG